MAKVKFKVFQKYVNLQGQGHKVKNYGLILRNKHVQYESPITSGLKVIAKVKVFQK